MILVMRCDAGPPHVPSRIVRCAGCGSDCWLSLAGGDSLIAASMTTDGEAVITCSPCLDEQLAVQLRLREVFGGGRTRGAGKARGPRMPNDPDTN